jgi:hypothetical protein
MNVLLSSLLGALLAKPWLDPVGLFGAERWYLPLSRLWAAANVAGEDAALFRDNIGGPQPDFRSAGHLRATLDRHARARLQAEAARRDWDDAIFAGPHSACDAASLDRQRRRSATRHLSTRAWFYPLLFGRRVPPARWRLDGPGPFEQALGRTVGDPAALYGAAIDGATVEVAHAAEIDGRREYWLRAPTPSARLRQSPGSERLYARVVEPVAGSQRTLISGNGLCLETDLLPMPLDSAAQLAAMGWRVIEPVSPYHGLRAMPGYYGGEPFFALAPTRSLDLIAGQAVEAALLIAWARGRFGGKVALAGISLTSFVAQQAASHCHLWPAAARPDAVMLINHSAHIENVAFGGALAAMLGLDRALADAGWTRELLAQLSQAVNPAAAPALAPDRIVSVLGETDRWVPYEDGETLVRQWRLPEANVFRYPLGHLGTPVQLMRDSAPFERLRQVLDG